MPVQTRNELIIIGAGPAGLTAAWTLARNAKSSLVLEADSLVGGISRTVNYHGYRFDIGGHRFFTKIDRVEQIWHDILEGEFLLRPRLSRIYYNGKFFDYPLKMGNALQNLGLVESFLIMLSYARAQAFPARNENNFEEWVSNRFGYRLYRTFFKTYTEKVWGLECKSISSDWAAQRIKNLSLTQALKNAIFGNNTRNKDEIVTSLIEQFHYPKLGPGMMWEVCAEKLVSMGTEIAYNQQVEQIQILNDHSFELLVRSDKELQTYYAKNVISTMPLREMILAIRPDPPSAVKAAATKLSYRDYLTVVLILDKKEVFPDNWIYIHSPEVRMGRIQNYKNWSPEMVSDENHTSLGLEYFLWEDDPEWSWPDEKLIELGKAECERLGLIQKEWVIDGTVVRMKKAYPIYDENYKKALTTIQAWLESIPNLETIGRNGLHRYNNQDHSMLTGVYAAENYLESKKHNVWQVNTEKEYHETGERTIPEPVDDLDQTIEKMFAPYDPVALGTAIGFVSGFGLFLMTAILLLKGGPVIGPTLRLLSNYFIGYSVSWSGAVIIFLQGSLAGFVLGSMIAWLRNATILWYAHWLKRKQEAEQERDLLDKV
jgi:protoporphyrinogen oxidase